MNFSKCKSCGKIHLEGQCFKHDDCLLRRVSALSFNYRIFTKEQDTFQEISLLPAEDQHQRTSLQPYFYGSNEEFRATNESDAQAALHSLKSNINSRNGTKQQLNQSALMKSDLGNVNQEFSFASHNESYSSPKLTERLPLRPWPIYFSPMHQDIRKNLRQVSYYYKGFETTFPSHNESFPILNLSDATKRIPVIPRPVGSISTHSDIKTEKGQIGSYHTLTETSSKAEIDESPNKCDSFLNQNQLPLTPSIESEQQIEVEADKLATSGSRQLVSDNPGNDPRAVAAPSRRRHHERFCPECGTEFPSKSELELHSVVHFRETPFICDVCHKEFSRQILLNMQLRIHKGEKRFICEICAKPFTYKSRLRIHTLKHTGKKYFTCSTCGKAFKYEHSLNRHALIHAREKSFMCKICGKAFRQNCHLKRHALIHTGVKPFRCEICGRAFIEKSNLKKHAHIHKKKNV